MPAFLESAEWVSCKTELRKRYEANALPYHNLSHIEDCLEQLAVIDTGKNREALEIALWYHDVIYNPRGTGNEQASADFAWKQLAATSMPKGMIDLIVRLVIVTDHKTPPETDTENLIVDIDLSILGSPSEIYGDYSRKIRHEYSFVDDTDYRIGRQNVLESILQRDSIYYTEFLSRKWESQAQKNLESELLRLSR